MGRAVNINGLTFNVRRTHAQGKYSGERLRARRIASRMIISVEKTGQKRRILIKH